MTCRYHRDGIKMPDEDLQHIQRETSRYILLQRPTNVAIMQFERMHPTSYSVFTAAAIAVVLLYLPSSASARAMHLRIDYESENGTIDAEVDVDLDELSVEVFANGTQKDETVEELLKTYRMALSEINLDRDASVDMVATPLTSDNVDDRTRRTIFGPDERLPVDNSYRSPYCATGYLDSGCTAVFIGPYHALTAAHCVYNTATNTWRTSETNMWRRRNCNTAGERMYWRNVWSVTGYTVQHRQDYDYALIIYDESNPSPCWLSFGYDSSWPDVGFDIFGYPGDKSSLSGCAYESMWFTSCHYSDTTDSDRRFVYRCDAIGGNSGSGLYAEKKDSGTAGRRVVYGVHTQSSPTWSIGNRINRDRFCQIVRWMQDSGYTPMCGSSPCCS